MVTAMICWHLYAQQRDWRVLVVSYLLAFLSFLVRSQEFLLVLIVSIPLLPWRTVLSRRSAQVGFLVLVSAIVISTLIDHKAYEGLEWKAYNELNPVRALFTDFGVGEHLKLRPDILEKHGYSINDIDLIGNWFYVDPRVANPDVLNAMLAELGPLPTQENAIVKGWVGVQTLWDSKILPLVFISLLLAVLRPSWQLTASWGLCIAAVFSLGVLGRPGVLRVYVPLVSLLVVAPFLKCQASRWRNRLGECAIFFVALLNTSHVFSESKTFQFTDEQVRKDLVNFPRNPVVIWGGAFPFEAAYPVLQPASSAKSFQLYALGTSTLAPFAFAYAEEKAGHSMINRLMNEKGIQIIANDLYFGCLASYCREHLHGQLRELSSKQYGKIVVSQRRCEIGQ